MDNVSNLIIRRIVLDRDRIENFNRYPFNIELIKNINL